MLELRCLRCLDLVTMLSPVPELVWRLLPNSSTHGLRHLQPPKKVCAANFQAKVSHCKTSRDLPFAFHSITLKTFTSEIMFAKTLIRQTPASLASIRAVSHARIQTPLLRNTFRLSSSQHQPAFQRIGINAQRWYSDTASEKPAEASKAESTPSEADGLKEQLTAKDKQIAEIKVSSTSASSSTVSNSIGPIP
jgi:hypothetical protein